MTPDINAIIGARPALFLDALRGGIVWLGGERDTTFAGSKHSFWVVSYRVAAVLVWNRALQQSERLGQEIVLN